MSGGRRTILVTGATGVVGSALVPVLLEDPGNRLVLLIRAESDAHLGERLAELCAWWGREPAELAASGQVRAIRGDALRPRLGLSEDEHERLAGELTHIVHAAGNVRLNQSLDAARADAVQPLANVVALARECLERGQFRKLEHVSTVGVAGRMPGRVPEGPLASPRRFHNTYEAAKAEAEELLLSEMRAGLPATIHRPSMVVGDSRTGRVIRFQVFYHLAEFLSGARTAGVLPRLGGFALDVVPSDYVARCIAVSLASPEAAGRVFHLSSGRRGELPLDDLGSRTRALMAARGVPLRRLRRFPLAWFRRTVPLAARLVPGRAGRALRTLPHFLAYLEDRQEFDNSSTVTFFAARGVELPMPNDYLEAVIGEAATKRGERK